MGYVAGVGETMAFSHRVSIDDTFSICFGDSPSPAAMQQAVLNYGSAHPERWNDDMLIVTGAALQAVWPCP
jgi:hypothetical protein